MPMVVFLNSLIKKNEKKKQKQHCGQHTSKWKNKTQSNFVFNDVIKHKLWDTESRSC